MLEKLVNLFVIINIFRVIEHDVGDQVDLAGNEFLGGFLRRIEKLDKESRFGTFGVLPVVVLGEDSLFNVANVQVKTLQLIKIAGLDVIQKEAVVEGKDRGACEKRMHVCWTHVKLLSLFRYQY